MTKVKAQQQQQQKVDVAGGAAGTAAGSESAAGSRSDTGRSDLMQQLLQLESQVSTRPDSPAVYPWNDVTQLYSSMSTRLGVLTQVPAEFMCYQH